MISRTMPTLKTGLMNIIRLLYRDAGHQRRLNDIQYVFARSAKETLGMVL